MDDYDGVFERLHVSPGEHDVVIYHDGYRSLQEKLYLRPNATQKISGKMAPLAAGVFIGDGQLAAWTYSIAGVLACGLVVQGVQSMQFRGRKPRRC